MIRFVFFVLAAAFAAAAPASAGGALLSDLAHVETSADTSAPVAAKIDWPVCAATGSEHALGTDPFTGARAFHAGLDFPAPFGTAVLAAAPGRVSTAERRGPYGLTVEIDHGRDLRTRYAHVRSTSVKAGDLVRAGQQIAEVGSTGRSKGPHLHFEVWYRDRTYDPRLFLKAQKLCAANDENAPPPALRGAAATDPGAKTVRFSWPVCVPTGTGFGYRVDPFTGRATFHSGTDFPTDFGVAVRASARGRVIAAETRGPYGNMIEIDHGYGYRTRYGHLQGYSVTAGDMVARGQVIGTVGSSGLSSGPHLHFEIWYNNVVRNPLKLLQRDPACSPRRR